MKISRKLQRMVENKIRHSMATGSFHGIERASTTGPLPRPVGDKSASADPEQVK